MNIRVLINYLKKLILDQRFTLLALTGFSLLFQFFYVWLVLESELRHALETYMAILPSGLLSFVGIDMESASIGPQFLAFGYKHPLVIITLSFLPVSLASRYLSGEIENRSFDIILAKPLHRSMVPLSLFIFFASAMALQFGAISLGSFASIFLFDLEVSLPPYLSLASMGFLFYLSMGALAFLIATYQDERGKAIARIIGLLIGLYFFDTIVKLTQSLKFLLPFSYFDLFQPVNISLGRGSLLSPILVFLIIGISSLVWATLHFNRRDL